MQIFSKRGLSFLLALILAVALVPLGLIRETKAETKAATLTTYAYSIYIYNWNDPPEIRNLDSGKANMNLTFSAAVNGWRSVHFTHASPKLNLDLRWAGDGRTTFSYGDSSGNAGPNDSWSKFTLTPDYPNVYIFSGGVGGDVNTYSTVYATPQSNGNVLFSVLSWDSPDIQLAGANIGTSAWTRTNITSTGTTTISSALLPTGETNFGGRVLYTHTTPRSYTRGSYTDNFKLHRNRDYPNSSGHGAPIIMPGIDITSPATFANPSTTHNFSATGVFPNGQNLSAVTVAWGVKNAPTGVSINSTSGALTTTAATPSGNITVTVSYNGYVYEAEFYYTAPRKVTLTDYNGAHTNSPNPVPVNVGSSTTLPNYGNFTGTAYSFYGWMLSTTSFLNEQPSAPALVHSLPSFSYTPSGDVELYAIYRKSDGSGGYIYTRAPKYAVTLDDRGSTSDVQVSPGSSTTLPGSAYGSWGFYGWILSSTSFTNGQTTAPTPLVGSPYTPSGDVTLYAIYLRNGIYTREPTAPFNPANYTPVSTLGAQARMNLAGIRFGGAMDVKELNKIAAESLSGITVQYGMLLAAYPFSPVVGEEIVDNNGGYAMDFKGGMGVLYVIQSSVTGNFSLAGCTLPNPQLANVICSENGGNQNFAWDPGFGVDIGKRSAAEVLAILGKNGGIGLTLFDVINSGGACVSIQYATVIDDLGTILARQGFYFAFRPYVIITGEFEVGVVSSYAFYGQQRVNSAWRIINGSEITSGGGLTHASFAAPDIQLNPFAGPGAPFLPIAP